MTCADSDQVGQTISCVSCTSPVVVPDATPDRIKAGEEFSPIENPASATLGVIEQNLSDEEIFRIANENVKEESAAKGIQKVASKGKRFAGVMIDSLAVVITIILGAILTSVCCPEPNVASMVMLITLPLMLGVCQMFLTATEGKTIGKYVVRSKIINQLGNPPGFVQGVLLRQFVAALLGLIPFFSLADGIWIFTNDSNRCLHDIIAGTTVVDG